MGRRRLRSSLGNLDSLEIGVTVKEHEGNHSIRNTHSTVPTLSGRLKIEK